MAQRLLFNDPTMPQMDDPSAFPQLDAANVGGGAGAADPFGGMTLPAGGTPTIPPTAVPTPPSQLAPPPANNNFLAGDNYNTPIDPPTATATAALSTTPTTYAIPGFDTGKLNDPNFKSDKYTPAVKHFAAASSGLAPTAASLQQIANQAKAAGFPNAVVVGKDRIDYGDGNGPIDAIVDEGGPGAHWWFQNGPDRFGTTAAPPPGGAPAPPGPPAQPGGSGPQPPNIPDLIAKLFPPTDTGPELPGGYAPPGDAGVFLSDFLQQMGQDPDSQLISSALAGLMENGGTPYGTSIADTLAQVIGGGGTNLPTAGVKPALAAASANGGANLPTQSALDAIKGFTGGLEGSRSSSAFDPTVAAGGADLPMERIMAQLDAIMNGGDTIDPAARRNRLVAARDANASAFLGQTADARGLLAERGGLSQPGVNQGPENTAIGRISTTLAPAYANSIRDIETADMDRASANRMAALGLKSSALGTETGAVVQGKAAQDAAAHNRITDILQSMGLSADVAKSQADNLTRVLGLQTDVAKTDTSAIMDSLSLATGLSQSQAKNVLDAAGAGTARQTALSNIALSTLQQNQDWNKFLAEFGLNHDMVMEQLQQGRINAITPLLQLLLTAGSSAAGGYI